MNTRISINLPDDVLERLRTAAYERKCTRQELIVEALTAFYGLDRLRTANDELSAGLAALTAEGAESAPQPVSLWPPRLFNEDADISIRKYSPAEIAMMDAHVAENRIDGGVHTAPLALDHASMDTGTHGKLHTEKHHDPAPDQDGAAAPRDRTRNRKDKNRPGKRSAGAVPATGKDQAAQLIPSWPTDTDILLGAERRLAKQTKKQAKKIARLQKSVTLD